MSAHSHVPRRRHTVSRQLGAGGEGLNAAQPVRRCSKISDRYPRTVELRNCYKCNAAHRWVCRIDESPLAPGAVSAENQRDLRVTNLRTPSAPEVTVSWALSKARSTLPLR